MPDGLGVASLCGDTFADADGRVLGGAGGGGLLLVAVARTGLEAGTLGDEPFAAGRLCAFPFIPGIAIRPPSACWICG